MLSPFLLIGVGGSGGKTLRVIRDDLTRRLEQEGWNEGLPKGWQFLHVDIPTHADGNEPDLPEHLPLRAYQGLVAPGLTYRNIDNALAGYGRTALGDLLAGWRPDPHKVTVPVEKGAGQYRALGRLITIANLDRVMTAIERCRREMHGAEVTGELGLLTELLGDRALPMTPNPVVVVISSLAGGSGAGAIIDVCDAVRSLGDPWASESVGILYAPDVFDYLPEEKRRGVRPNALATLSELLACYWGKDGPSESTAQLLAGKGVQLGAVDRLGPRYCFLVGSRNDRVSYATQNEIYRAMGRAIAAWVASVPLQDRMVAYVQGNMQASATAVPDLLPLKATYVGAPFAALGAARVSLGRDRFREYAAERLARLAVEVVLHRHEERRARDDDRRPQTLVKEQADRAFLAFLTQSKLFERGEDRNDILDSIRPEDQARLRALANDVRQRVTQGVPARGLTTAQWVQRILTQTREKEGEFHRASELERTERALAWTTEIQDILVPLAALWIAREGAPIAVELFRRLADEELKFVSQDLTGEREQRRRRVGEQAQYVESELRSVGSDVIPATNPQVAKAVDRAVQALEWEAEARLRELVIELIPDLTENLVSPLGRAIEQASQALAHEAAADSQSSPVPINLWPRGDHLPQRLQPASNEFLIDPVESYPTVLNSLIARSVDSDSVEGALRTATMLVVLGASEFDHREQLLIEQLRKWVPQRSDLHRSAADTSTRAAFDVRLTGLEILQRARAWVVDSRTRLGQHMRDNLRDYLTEDPDDAAESRRRLQRFESQFIAAYDSAAPLVNINKGVLVQVHQRNEAPSDTFFTQIPFPPRSRGREVVQRVLEGKGAWTAEAEKALVEGTASYIDLFSVLREPYEPVVFDSLMRPIASEWGVRNRTPDLRSEFWRWRRCRPLTEFIPVSPEIRRAMVRGWFTAALLGQLRLGATNVSIFVRRDTGGPGRWMPFPDPLLVPDVGQNYEYLPAILKSLPIALVELGVQASLAPIEPFARLRDLGKSGRGGEYEEYDAANPELEQWIVKGKLAPAAPLPDPTKAGSPADDSAKRREAVEARFEHLRAQHERLFDEVKARTDVFDVPRVWDLRDDLTQAFDDLVRAVRHVNPEPDSDYI